MSLNGSSFDRTDRELTDRAATALPSDLVYNFVLDFGEQHRWLIARLTPDSSKS